MYFPLTQLCVSNYPATLPSDQPLHDNKPDSKNRNLNELGPPCQKCKKRLLSPSARICEHCGSGQRPSNKVSSVPASKTSKIPRLNYQKVFGKKNGSLEVDNSAIGSRRPDISVHSDSKDSEDAQNPRKRSSSSRDPGDVSSAKQFKGGEGFSESSRESQQPSPEQVISECQ